MLRSTFMVEPTVSFMTSDGSAVIDYVTSLSNWGRWGPDDERGTLNLITPAQRIRAAALVRDGVTVSCAREITTDVWPREHFSAPMRLMVQTGEGLADAHRLFNKGRPREPVNWASEYIGMVFHGKRITHLDAPAHFVYDRRLYNGYPAELVSSLFGATKLAVTACADGIVTRGVLLDIAALRGLDWLEVGTPILPNDLEAAEARQGVCVEEGDALLVRTGFTGQINVQGPPKQGDESAPGLHASCLPWLRERGVAMLGSDAVNDVMPSGTADLTMPIHTVALASMGLWLMDNMDLEDLVARAGELGRWEFQFVLAPLRFAGGTGSPANPLAVF
jgi:kynurenine formamidase